MSARSLAGLSVLVRTNLLRDRIVIPLCVAVLALEPVADVASYPALYSTPQARSSLTATSAGNTAMRALYGPAYDLSTAGGWTAWRIGGIVAAGCGLLGLLLMVRHTRVDEETGRTELLRSAVTGRHAPLAAAVFTAMVAALAIGAVCAVLLVAQGQPAAGSITLGAGFTVTTLVFAGVGAVTAQLTERARTARALAGGVLGTAYLLRAVGDGTPGIGWCSWLSPIGWAQHARSFAGDRPLPLLLGLAVTAALLAVAAVLECHRDIGAGVVPARPGRPGASRRLTGVVALGGRMQRASLAWWCAGLLITGLATGAIATGLLDSLQSTPSVTELLQRMGGRGRLVDTFFAALIPTIAVVTVAHGVGAISRLRSEEATGRAELLLSTGTSRARLAVAHVLWALVGPVALMIALALGLGLGYATSGGGFTVLPSLLGACLAQVPAIWVLLGVGALALAVAPRLMPIGWVVLGCCAFLAWVGPLLRVPHAVMAVSPFSHVADLPGAPVPWGVLLACTALSGVLLALAATAYRRRDIGA